MRRLPFMVAAPLAVMRFFTERALVAAGAGGLVEPWLRRRIDPQKVMRARDIEIHWAYDGLEALYQRRGDFAGAERILEEHTRDSRLSKFVAEAYLTAACRALTAGRSAAARELLRHAREGPVPPMYSPAEFENDLRFLEEKASIGPTPEGDQQPGGKE